MTAPFDPLFSDQATEYVRAVRAAVALGKLDADLLSTDCVECGEDSANGPMAFPHRFAHRNTDDALCVIVCCEGYYQVNPNLVGISAPNWSNEGGELSPEQW